MMSPASPSSIQFEPRPGKAAHALLAPAGWWLSAGNRRLGQAAGAIAAAIAEGKATPPADGDPATKPYSVLLLYPDYANDSGTETYYAFVEASRPDRCRRRGPATGRGGPG